MYKRFSFFVRRVIGNEKTYDIDNQAICILANIADGDSAKSFIMSNEVKLLFHAGANALA
jgi:hypothetical protein